VLFCFENLGGFGTGLSPVSGLVLRQAAYFNIWLRELSRSHLTIPNDPDLSYLSADRHDHIPPTRPSGDALQAPLGSQHGYV
jgi:hypothetical protein